MKQTLNKLVKQKTKVNKDIGKIYYNKETNEKVIKKKLVKKLKPLKELFLKEKTKIKK